MFTGTHTSDDVGNPDPVTADCNASEVIIRPRNPIDYRVYCLDISQSYITRTGGESFTFRQLGTQFTKGQIVGYSEIPSGGGTQTFDKISL